MTRTRGLVLGRPSKNDRPVHNNALEVVDGGIGRAGGLQPVSATRGVGSSMGPLAFLASFSSDFSDGVQTTALLRDKLMVFKSLIITAELPMRPRPGLDRVNI